MSALESVGPAPAPFERELALPPAEALPGALGERAERAEPPEPPRRIAAAVEHGVLDLLAGALDDASAGRATAGSGAAGGLSVYA